MKRTMTVLAVLSLCAIAFAAGNAAPKLKFPWAGASGNADAGLTKIEAKCLELSFWVPEKPLDLLRTSDKVIYVRSIRYEPTKDGIIIDAKVATSGVLMGSDFEVAAGVLRRQFAPATYPIAVRFHTYGTPPKPLYTSPAK